MEKEEDINTEVESINPEIENIKRFFSRNRILNYIINPDMTVSIYDSFSVNLDREKVNFTIKEVSQNFSLRRMYLDKLPKCPERIGWNVLININSLTSLEGLPKFINGNLHMMHNKLDHSKDNFEILLNTYIGGYIEADEDFMIAFDRYRTIKEITNP